MTTPVTRLKMHCTERVRRLRSDSRLYEKLLALLIVAGFILRVALICQDMEVLLSKFLSDDSYYYYSLAQNVIKGQGAVFNHGIPTNGFQPLYLLILVPVFKLLYPFGVDLPVYASLFLASTLSLGTALFLFLIGSTLLNKKAGLLAAFIWLFNPYILFVSLMGMETPLQVFFLSWLTYFLVSRKGRDRLSLPDAALAGLLIGLTSLSRMDGAFVAVGIGCTFSVRKLLVARGAGTSNVRSLFGLAHLDLPVTGFTALLTAVPWLAWNLLQVDRITPVSGEALRTIRLGSSPYLNWIFASANTTMEFAANLFGVHYVWPSATTLLLTICAALVVPLAILTLAKDSLMPRLIRSLDFLIISAASYYAFYWFYQLGLRDWYSLFTSFLVAVVFSTSVVALIQRVQLAGLKKALYASLACTLISVFAFTGVVQYQAGNYPQENLKREVARYIETNIPANETIGAFNTGVYQYYTPDHDVINLDGVINPEAHEAMKKGNLAGYILRKGIDYIVDPPKYVEMMDRSILKIEPIRTFEMSCSRCPRSAKGELEIGLFRVTRR